MNSTTAKHHTQEEPQDESRPLDTRASFRRTLRHWIEYDRRSWNRLMRQFDAEGRCLYRSIKALTRPNR